MKLNATQALNVEEQLNARTLPDDHPIISDLTDEFGHHTFFLDAGGVNIVEPSADPSVAKCSVVRVAAWNDEAQTELVLHPPEVLPVSVEFETNGSAPNA